MFNPPTEFLLSVIVFSGLEFHLIVFYRFQFSIFFLFFTFLSMSSNPPLSFLFYILVTAIFLVIACLV